MEKKKGLPHFICEKVPVLAIVLGIIIPLLIFSSTDGIGNSMFGEGALFYLFTAFLGAVFIALVRLWFLPDYKGAARLNASFAEVTRILIPFFLYVVVSAVLSIIFGEFGFAPTLTKLCMGISAGFSEEAMFRAATIPIGLGFIKSEKRVGITIGVSSIIFGALHFANIKGGGQPSVISLQAFATVFMGIYLAMLFIRSGSILLPIVVHGFWDYFCFTTDTSLEDGIVVQQQINLSLVLQVVINVALGIAGIVLLYKSRDRIKQMWNGKWSRP